MAAATTQLLDATRKCAVAAEREREAVSQQLAGAVQERDALAQERDALAQERDAIAQERDAARAQLDAASEGRGALARGSEDRLRARDVLAREARLKHAVSACTDFDPFRVSGVLRHSSNSTVLACALKVPAWCLADDDDDEAVAVEEVEVEVAVKVLPSMGDPRPKAIRHMLKHEYLPLCALPAHPHVLSLLAHFVAALPRAMFDMLPEGMRLMVGRPEDPVLALVMPLHPQTLEQAVRAEPAPSGEQLVRWCVEVASAVAHLWRHRWVHMDLDLSEVLVSAAGRAVLTDLGSSRRLHPDERGVSLRESLNGNLAHRAPEVVEAWREAERGQGRDPAHVVLVDAGRQVVWALGVLLHKIMTGGAHPCGECYPLHGADVEPEVDEAALVARGMPAGMVEVVRRMVSRDAGARPADPVAARAELARCASV